MLLKFSRRFLWRWPLCDLLTLEKSIVCPVVACVLFSTPNSGNFHSSLVRWPLIELKTVVRTMSIQVIMVTLPFGLEESKCLQNLRYAHVNASELNKLSILSSDSIVVRSRSSSQIGAFPANIRYLSMRSRPPTTMRRRMKMNSFRYVSFISSILSSSLTEMETFPL